MVMPTKKVYISGDITEENHKLNFMQHEETLLNKGFIVLSPIRTTAYTHKLPVKECFFDSLKWLFFADFVVQISDPKKTIWMQIEQMITEYLNIPIDNSLLNK